MHTQVINATISNTCSIIGYNTQFMWVTRAVDMIGNSDLSKDEEPSVSYCSPPLVPRYWVNYAMPVLLVKPLSNIML